jgi:outer membrane receptor protein involved in Fe transport
MGASSFTDYARFLPALSILSRGDGNSRFQIRGISPVNFGSQTTAIYFDETPVGSQFGQPDMPVLDLQRVELLRGPQGTLYGEASLGGTVRLISNKPDPDAFSLSGTLETSTTKGGDASYQGSGVINIPIGEKAALRASASYRRKGGWIDSIGVAAMTAPESVVGDIALTGSLKNRNERDIFGARVGLRMLPTDRLTIDLSFMYTSIEGDDVDLDFSDSNINTPALGRDETDFQIANFRKDDFAHATFSLKYEFDAFEITSTTSYFERDLDELATQPIWGFGPAGPVNDWSYYFQDDEYWSHETRFTSTGDGPFQWIGGIFYRDRDIGGFSDFESTSLLDAMAAFGLPPQQELLSYFTSRSFTQFEHKAIFGSLTYSVTDQLDITVGVRYFEEDQSALSARTISQGFDPALLQAAIDAAVASGTPVVLSHRDLGGAEFDTSDDDISPRFNITYRANENWTVYGTVAEGFRSGGVNRNAATDRVTGVLLPERQGFESDAIWSYEIGSKNTFMDGRLIVNSAAFFIDWKDLQADGVVDGVVQRWVTNQGKAESKGFEVEAVAVVGDGWSLTGFVSYSDAELSEDSSGQPNGTPLPAVAPWKFGGSAQYEWPLANGMRGRVRADYSYLDDQRQSLSQTSRIIQSHEQINIRAAIEAETWSVELFADNLTNEYASLGIDNGYPGRFRNRPRTIGLRLSMDMM